MRCLPLILLLALPLGANTASARATPIAGKPAAMAQMVLPSHGVMLYGIFISPLARVSIQLLFCSTDFPALSRTWISRSICARAAGTC
jgi:hypothetical protein